MTTLNTSPKAAKRQKQMAARERKRAQAEKQRAKKATRPKGQPHAFLDSLERWMLRDPPEAFTDQCPACAGVVYVTYEDGRMQHAHGEPSCEGYRTLEQIMGNESPPLETWDNPAAPSQLPAWARGPHRELTTEEGVELMDAGEIDNSMMVMHGLPDGGSQASMIARTKDGLYWWPMGTLADEEDDEDEE